MNLLFICTDQYRWDCLSCLGHPAVRTPNLDALAADGTLFSAAYAATAPCAPSRASIFTGQYPDAHGVHNGMDDLDPPDQRLLTQHLQAAGVPTALIGKLHLHPFERDFGFDVFERSDSFYPNYLPAEVTDSAYIRDLRKRLPDAEVEALIERFSTDEDAYVTDQYRFIVGTNVVPEDLHPTTWTVDRAIDYLQDPPDAPFFLNVSIYGPHQPYACPPPWDTAYDPATLPLPADFDVTLDDKPIMARNGFFSESRVWREQQGWTRDTYRQALAAYYGNISMIDAHLGRLFQALRDTGQWDDTLIVFTADHGDYAGQFRNFFKSLGYEGSAHVPMIVRDPRSDRRGDVEDRPVNLIDLYATTLALFGLDPAAYDAGDSRSLLPLLRQPAPAWEPVTYFKQNTNAAVVSDQLKLIRDEIGGETVYELYDLRETPVESVNRYFDPAYAAPAAALRRLLDGWYADQLANRAELADTPS